MGTFNALNFIEGSKEMYEIVIKDMCATDLLDIIEDIDGESMSKDLISLGTKHNLSKKSTMLTNLKYNLYEKKLRLLDEKVEPDIEYYKEFYIWSRHHINHLENMQKKMAKVIMNEGEEESQESRYEQARQETEMAAQEQRERWENNLTDDIGYGRGVRPDKSARNGFSGGWQKK
jgi:hypothetical protein